jgi:hypothetical protein
MQPFLQGLFALQGGAMPSVLPPVPVTAVATPASVGFQSTSSRESMVIDLTGGSPGASVVSGHMGAEGVALATPTPPPPLVAASPVPVEPAPKAGASVSMSDSVRLE